MRKSVSCVAPLLSLLISAGNAAEDMKGSADLAIVNARVWTVEDTQPLAEAIAVRDGRILAVGYTTGIQTLVSPSTRVIDASGRLVLPGFQDNHTHFINSGEEVGQLNLKNASTHEEFGKLVAEYAQRKKPGEWITGGGWDHDKFPGGELPTAELVDRYCPDKPVFVNRFDGHMAVANTLALKLGNVTSETTDPLGGSIVRKPGSSEPAGVLKDAAMSLVYRVVPRNTHEQMVEAARKAFGEARRFGITTVHDMLTGDGQLEAYKAVRAEGGMTARVYGRWPIADWKRLAKRVRENGIGDDMLTIRGVKGFMDGSIGSSTAFMFNGYEDDQRNVGLPGGDLNRLAENCLGADSAGLQLCIHAIGDRAIYELLNIFERVERTNGPRDRRPRIEHDQHTHPRDFRRHVELGAIASVQPYHAIDDGRFVEKRIGRKRSMSSYAYRTFLDAGVRMCFGSDWNVAPLDPILGIDAAVNRQTLDGKNPDGWFPEQKISVEEAIRAYTIESAYAAFMEGKTGSIAPGKYADIVILSQDLLSVPESEIKNTEVDFTILGGKVVYERELEPKLGN